MVYLIAIGRRTVIRNSNDHALKLMYSDSNILKKSKKMLLFPSAVVLRNLGNTFDCNTLAFSNLPALFQEIPTILLTVTHELLPTFRYCSKESRQNFLL